MKELNKSVLTPQDIAYMIDPSVLKLDTCVEDVERMVEASVKYGFGCCFAWPCYYERLSAMLKGTGTAFGVSLAFPSGQESTYIKEVQAELFMRYEPAEVDMVMNVGLLKSNRYDEAIQDIQAVRKIVGPTSLKVIIEAMLLSDEEIRTACRIVLDAGADYVKSGTGFSVNQPTTLHHIDVIKSTIQDNIKFKVAGGVRDLDTLLKMYKRGAVRFGIGLNSAVKIIEEAYAAGHDIDLSTIA